MKKNGHNFPCLMEFNTGVYLLSYNQLNTTELEFHAERFPLIPISQIQLFLDFENVPRLSVYKFALISKVLEFLSQCSLYHLKQPKDTPTFPFCNITRSASLTPR